MVSYRKRKKAYQTAKRKGKTYNNIEPNFRSNIYIESAEVNPNSPLEVREVNRANHMLYQISHLFDSQIVLKDVTKEELAWITSKEFQTITSEFNDMVRVDKSVYKDASSVFRAEGMISKVFKEYVSGSMGVTHKISKGNDFRKQLINGYKKLKQRLRELNIDIYHLTKNTIPVAQIVYYQDNDIR